MSWVERMISNGNQMCGCLYLSSIMRKKIIPILVFLTVSLLSKSQNDNDTIHYSLNIQLNGGTGSYAPFLSTVNEQDRFLFSPNSLSGWGTLHKGLSSAKKLDYGYGFELDGNLSANENRLFPGEFYVQGKIYFLNIYAGSKQQVYGNQDAKLSSGGMMWSQNSRPLPKIAVETGDYIVLPYTKGYLEVKGGLSHGWFNHSGALNHLLLHHKYGYIRIGGSFPVNLNYGIQHVAQWGGRYGQDESMPVNWDNYFRIFQGKCGSSSANWSDQENTLGNHILSQNLGLDLKFKSIKFSLYWQNIMEDPPLKFITGTMNVEDGLWGLSVKRPKSNILNHFVFEYLSTTDQSGPWNELDGIIYGGADNYYTNGSIPAGWTYRGMTLGNPWLTSPRYNNGSVSITNNTVRLYYFSGEGKLKSVNYRLTLAYSENFGLPKITYEGKKNQFSWQLKTSMPLKNKQNTKISLGITNDLGSMYGNNLALILGFSHSGVIRY